MQHDALVVSNDKYRDHIAKYASRSERETARRWLAAHLITYAFVGDEFLPNPDFVLPPPSMGQRRG